MKYLEGLHHLKIFHKRDAVGFIKDENNAKETLRRYKKLGLIAQVRRDLYVATDLGTKASLASKYEIAGHVTPSSYLAYHAALEYHGLAHKVLNILYISSIDAFRNFEYDGIRYIFCQSYSDAGIICPATDSHVRVTDLERTVLDCINHIDLSGGLEELIQCLAIITVINESKLLEYLACFDKPFLYQKTGFILRYFQKEMNLSDDFFELCKSKTGQSARYLTNKHESDTYFKEWRLIAPHDLLSFLEQGGNEYV